VSFAIAGGGRVNPVGAPARATKASVSQRSGKAAGSPRAGAWDETLDGFASELARAEALIASRPTPEGDESEVVAEVLSLRAWDTATLPSEPLPEHLREWANVLVDRQRSMIEKLHRSILSTKREIDAVEALAPNTGRVRPVFVDSAV